jgi:hypothetical protein
MPLKSVHLDDRGRGLIPIRGKNNLHIMPPVYALNEKNEIQININKIWLIRS